MESNVRVLIFLLIGSLLCGCSGSRYDTIQGHTMGTYYRVVKNCSTEVTQEYLENELHWLNSILSNYESDSVISAFNRSKTIGEWIPAHEILIELIAIAQEVSAQTNGAFDITVAPLVELWGFGAEEVTQPPSKKSIEQALPLVSYELLEIDRKNKALLKLEDIQLDLSGIGKGYGVDHLAEILVQHDCSDFLVDIGGEIRVHGHNSANQPWQVGIEVPNGTGQIKDSLGMSDGAVATSGSYRNFRTFDQSTFPHLIDPRTGYPTAHNLLAVTVYHATTTKADAFATAFFVMGVDEALELAELEDIAIAVTTWDVKTEKIRTSYSTSMEIKMKGRE